MSTVKTKTDNYPFFRWVPKPLGILVLISMFVPLMFISGIYMSNVAEMVGTSGFWSEDFQMVNMCSFIGMSAFFPLMTRYLQVRNVKTMYVWGFSILIVLNLVLSNVESLFLLSLFSFVLGFVRAMLVLNTTFILSPYAAGVDTLAMFTLTKMPDPDTQYGMDHQRAVLLPVLYMLWMSLVEASNYVVAWIAYHYNWHFSYLLVSMMVGVALVLVLGTMRFGKRNEERYIVPWHQTLELLLTVSTLYALCYVLIYGKTLDWFASSQICGCTAFGMVALGLLVCISARKGEEAYINLRVFHYRQVWFGMGLFLLDVLANYGSSMMVGYIKMASTASNLHGAALSLWCIPGVVVGCVLSMLMARMGVRFKYIFAVGLLLMCATNAYLYFVYQPQGLYDDMKLPTVVNFTGMIILYVVVCAYGMCRLPAWLLPSWIFLMIAVRNVVAPSVSSAVYANLMQERQQHYTTRFVQDAPSLQQAPQMRADAVLMAMKDVTGDIVWLCAVGTVIVLACPRAWSLKS